LNLRFFTPLVMLAAATFLTVDTVHAHPMPISTAILSLDADRSYHLIVTFDVASTVMQSTEPGHLSDELAALLRTMPEAELQKVIDEARQVFARRTIIRCDGEPITAPTVEFPPGALLREGDTSDAGRKPRAVHLFGRAPPETKTISVMLPPDCGQVLLTVVRTDNSAERLSMSDGAASAEITWDGTARSSKLDVAWQYLVLGFEHILPKGLDHILFVLGLYLLSPQWKPLLWQVTMFTLAHSITLALSSLEVVSLPGSVVEPLIALSIAVVAVENLVTTELHRWRLPLVFGFGLLHGLGFAGVLGELGLPRDEFMTALVTFNLGVECGQLTVIGLAALAVGWFRQQNWYRWAIVQPISAAIALIGLYWTVERLGLLG
jgi:hypothetical protein